MSFIPKNPITIPEIENTPSALLSGTRGLFAKGDGWYEIDSAGEKRKLTVDNEIINSQKYYGDPTIKPSNQDLFNFEIDKEQGTAKIVGVWEEYNGYIPSELSGDIVIPYEYKIAEGNDAGVYTVTEIGEYSLHYSDITSVYIPNTITKIGDYALQRCFELTNITIPDSVISIGRGVFLECTSLNNICYRGLRYQWNSINIGIENDALFTTGVNYTVGDSRSATYYIGALDTPDNTGCNFICSNTEGNRFNDIIDKIMATIGADENLLGSKIIVRNGTYCQDDKINITHRCIMDFENEFDVTSEGNFDWNISAFNCIFNNFKSYGYTYVTGGANIFNNCTFVRNLYIGGESNDSITNAGADNIFRFCVFNKDVQVGDHEITTSMFINGRRASFEGCRFSSGNLLLASIETIVKNCHFAAGDKGVCYNGSFPDVFTGHFSGNTMYTGGWAETPLYDEVTSKYATVNMVYSKDEFDMCVVDGIYKVIYQNNPCFGIISSNAEQGRRWYTIWAPHLNVMLTKTTVLSTGEIISDYENLFIAAKCIQSVTIKGGASNWTKEEVKDASGAIVGYRYGQVVTVQNATITEYSKVDLQLSSEQVVIFSKKSLAFTAENDGGIITVYCVGSIPEEDYTMQVTVTEVVVHG